MQREHGKLVQLGILVQQVQQEARLHIQGLADREDKGGRGALRGDLRRGMPLGDHRVQVRKEKQVGGDRNGH